MKRTLIVLLLVNLMLSACSPASAPTSTPAPSATLLPTRDSFNSTSSHLATSTPAPSATLLPTATTVPTSTATPTSTPTATPTATPTPIPTIQVGSLSVPDPRVTNPELFDLRNPDAPIPQFVNAMKMAGIEITAEQVAQGIAYEALKDKDGNPFVVAVYNLDPYPNQTGEPLEGRIPLLIAKKTKNEKWSWTEAYLKLLGDGGDISVGTQSIINPLLYDRKWRETLINEFNTVTVDSGLYYAEVEPERGVFDFRHADLQIKELSELGFPIRGQSLIFPTSGSLFPDWLRNGNYSKDELGWFRIG